MNIRFPKNIQDTECPKDLSLFDDLVGIFRIEGRGRAVRYILVITASSNVITVVMIRVIAKKTPARGNCINQPIN